MLEVVNLNKSYDKLWANRNIHFSLQAGEVGILIGPNGAGKSTAIKSIVGLLRFQGEIRVNGFLNTSMEAKKELGYVPELPTIYDLLTVEEHIEFIIRAYHLNSEAKERAEKLLLDFGLEDKKHKLGKSLSKGMQQKVSIICALLPDPQVLLLDEPLVGLDPLGIKQLKRILENLRERGRALLISTHMLDSVNDLWDKAFIMNEGELVKIIDRNDVKEMATESLEELFFSVTIPWEV